MPRFDLRDSRYRTREEPRVEDRDFEEVDVVRHDDERASVWQCIELRIIDSAGSKFVPGIYHYSNEGVASWYDFAIEILAQSGEACRVKPILTEAYPLPAPRPHFSVLNKDKIKAVYDIEIPHWKSSLEECLAILKSNTQ